MTHIGWQPIKTWPKGSLSPCLFTDGKTWGVGGKGWFQPANFEVSEIKFTHWAEIGALPK